MIKEMSFGVVLLFTLCLIHVQCETTTPDPVTTDITTDVNVTADPMVNDTYVDSVNITESVPVVDEIPMWTKCLAEAAGNKTTDDSTIVSIFLSWCRDYKTVIPCLAEGLKKRAADNALDFFISLTFKPSTLKKRSKDICRQIAAVSSRILCAVNSSQIEAGRCTRRFSNSLRHIYSAFNDGVSRRSLRSLTCDLTHETTRCLDKTLPSCDKDIKQFLLTYYALFTAKKCIYKPSDPAIDEMAQESVTTTCARESSKLAKMVGPEPTNTRDTVVRGMRADCQTYETRFKCYERELKNPKQFWDRWLRHTFDLQNAIEGHREMCPRLDEIIEQLTPDCFNQSESSIMACENSFTATADQIRVMETERNLTDTEVAEMACSCTLAKVDCYKEAFSPCSQTLAEVMSHNILSLLPTECRDKFVTGTGTNSTDVTDTKALTDVTALSDAIIADGKLADAKAISNSVVADGKLTESSTPKDVAAVNKASNLFYLLLMTIAYNIT